jgi:hypothetical protein
LAALRFDFALLLLNLTLSLIILIVFVLHVIADRVAADTADAAANRSARQRMAHGRSDYSPSTGANHGANACAFFTVGKRLTRTSAKEEHNREPYSGGRNPTFAHKIYLLLHRTDSFEFGEKLCMLSV